jgi:predicted acyltransferase
LRLKPACLEQTGEIVVDEQVTAEVNEEHGRAGASTDETALVPAPVPERLPEVRPLSIPGSDRLLSIDALRGFDMFWIIGGREVLKTWVAWLVPALYWDVTFEFRHVPWDGFVFYDLIFPLFLFVVGAVLPFSLAKLRAQGGSATAVHWRIFRRAALLIALGLVYNNILQLDFANFRISGVLQRIGICYLAAALLVVHTGIRAQAAILVAILAGYWAVLAFVPVPGGTAGDFSMDGSLPGWVDRHWLPGKLLYYGHGDNEGILSTIPAIGTTLLGVLAGHWLRSSLAPGLKVVGLAVGGLACLVAGFAWSLGMHSIFTLPAGPWLPIIKNIWTSSYVLVAGGWSLLLLALFYGIIDVLGWRRWAFFFVVIGANAITIYVALRFIDFPYTTRFFLGGLARVLGGFGPVLLAMGVVALEWLLLLYLYKKRIFLRV